LWYNPKGEHDELHLEKPSMLKHRKPLSVNDLDLLYNTPQQREEETAPHSSSQLTARRAFASIVETAVQTLLLFLILSSLVGRFEIQQTSMEPTFHEGQRVVVSQLSHALPSWMDRTVHAANNPAQAAFGLKRGHVVVFYDQADHEDPPLIKRLIGLPGETIEIRNSAVFINGKRLHEPYLQNVPTMCHAYCGPLTLGEDDYFFMGDNRMGSRDSRNFGPVPGEQIVGRVIMRYWPLNDFALYE